MRDPGRATSRALYLLLLGVAVAFPAACSKPSTTAPPGPPAPPPPPTRATVLGVVQDQGGVPFAGALVTLESTAGPVPSRVRHMLAAGRERASAGRFASRAEGGVADTLLVDVTDTEGRFTFSDLPAGDYVLTGTARNHIAGVQPVRVPAAPDTVVVLLQLGATGSFHGRALLQDGIDHRHTVVFVEGTSYAAVTDSAGLYRIADVPLGDWAITATHPGYDDQSAYATLDQAGQDADLGVMELPRDLNAPPQAEIVIAATCAELGPATLSAGPGTIDPDGAIALYEWDFEDDGDIDSTGTALTQVVHFYTPGVHRPKLIVTDDQGAVGITARDVTIDDRDTLYVSATTGAPAGPGTRAAPFATLSQAFEAGHNSCPGRVILVAAGTYDESARSLNLESDLTLRGGFDPATWIKVPNVRSLVLIGGSPVEAFGILNTLVSGFEVRAGDVVTPGANSMALRVSASPVSLRFEDCRFVAGRGADGIPGAPGFAPPKTGDGQDGTGTLGGAGGTGYGASGLGGDGGDANTSAGDDGIAGAPGDQGTPGGPPGLGGADVAGCAGQGVRGGDGTPGTNGSPGAHGDTTRTSGSPSGANWVPNVGQPGANGSGGAGGGGGGAGGAMRADAGCGVLRGGAGGGGGSGAMSGGGAPGGGAGGASIAVFLSASSPRFQNCSFVAGQGGDGALGGNGGTGGEPGDGGFGSAGETMAQGAGGTGGAGGRGGTGGPGGGGQGGAGGPSWSLVRYNGSNPTLVTVTYGVGTGGAGGLGGLRGDGASRARTGSTGPATTVRVF